MRTVVVAAALAALSTIAGCTSEIVTATSNTGSASSSAATTTQSFCEAYCEKIASCDSTSDVQTCSETCADSISTATSKLRSEVVSEIRSCWDGSDCRQVLGGERLGECVDEAAVIASPNAKTKELCDALGGALVKCDSALDRAKCLEATKVYSDDRLDQAMKCTTKSCSAIMDCIDATL